MDVRWKPAPGWWYNIKYWSPSLFCPFANSFILHVAKLLHTLENNPLNETEHEEEIELKEGGSYASANINNNNSSIVLLKLHWKKRMLEWFFFFLSQDVHFPLIRISALNWVLASCLSIIYWRHILCWTQRWVTARAWVLWPACCCSIWVRKMHSTCSNSSCTTWGCGNSTGLIWSYCRYINIHIVTYSIWHQIIFFLT